MFRKVFSIIIFIMIVFRCAVKAQDVYSPYIAEQGEALFNESMFKIDVIDPKVSTNVKGANYPGLRGSNQLVIYTPSFGMRTNTNEFGTEAIVEGNVVTSLSGADSLIPINGFVISGHGAAKRWINENVMVGARISIDLEKNVITSYITSDTFLYGAKSKVKEVQDMMEFYSQTYTNYDTKKTQGNINKANDCIKKAQENADNSQKYSTKAIEYANQAMQTVIPYKPNELKGVWIRPTYFCRDDIVGVLNKLQDAGINNIFIETYYHGKTIFPSSTMEKYRFTKQYEEYIGFDPLKIWITEAHKRGIKVHIWFQTFYVGNKAPESNPNSILAQKPNWANYQKKNAETKVIAYSASEHNGYFLDPANPEVQAFLYELLCEIVYKYQPDGINLDYIRYPQSVASNFSNYDMSNWGYTEYARDEFKEIYGVDPMELHYGDALWRHWSVYRCNKVTNFVRKVSNLTRANKIQLTAVIFPNRTMAMDTKMQDWKNWSVNNFVDGFTPLFLTCDDKTEINLIEEVLRNKSSSTKLYAGLFVTFMNGSNSDLIKQIHALRKYGLNGLIIFDYAHFTKPYIEALSERIFKPVRYEVFNNEEKEQSDTSKFRMKGYKIERR